VDILRKKHGMTAEAAVERILALLDLQTAATPPVTPAAVV
jgi:hypothetical protein